MKYEQVMELQSHPGKSFIDKDGNKSKPTTTLVVPFALVTAFVNEDREV